MNFNEHKTNAITISRSLSERHPSVVGVFRKSGVGIFSGSVETKNIWARDYMPIQVGKKFVKFAFGGYGKVDDGHPDLYVNPRDWSQMSNLVVSKIRLDGGNVQRDNGTTVVTDMIFRHNPTVKNLVSKLEHLLQSGLLIIPAEPGCDIGHSDGVLHFVPGTKKVIVQDYTMTRDKKLCKYFDELVRILSPHYEIITIPCAYNRTPKISKREFVKKYPHADLFLPAFGLYVNFLVVGKLIFMPNFGIAEDAEAEAVVLRHFADCAVWPVDCHNLSMEGGVLNCVATAYQL